jgi:hypothetical protein
MSGKPATNMPRLDSNKLVAWTSSFCKDVGEVHVVKHILCLK